MKFAMYDPVQDKIFNCKKGTLEYYHEVGHRLQYKSGLYQTYEQYEQLSLYVTLGCLAFGQSYFAIFFFLTLIYFHLYPEVDAWIYAYRQNFNSPSRAK